MTHKIAGCCSICDAECFEIKQRWDAGELRAGEPKRIGKPLPGSMRITFKLIDGTTGDFTLCGNCAEVLHPAQYPLLWTRNLAGYMREQQGNPEKFIEQFNNGILCELGRIEWKELQDGIAN